ncbi:biotin-requiring enzyme [Pseudomassariella vexata]|uniref:Biotin-requiring enzyme n=1 Tax=Pseudomassariella vexata TaxID=1141098 RepID=A0A1Y2EE21_9PEZI|nr:biotin-requiring enzyme [Pseudomassariella vexata]ORY69828.1 biotin-requiring enzyme [Pseudomassariella vexata]
MAASFATVCRVSTRLVSRRVTQGAAVRGFRTSAALPAAQNFTMPALSPTMTEGNIATWKVKEGDGFAAGDVLLEIETDKASMDVEAQEDGIMFKIFEGDGTKGIQVGTRIGLLAEPGDDISQLEIPADESKPAAKEAKREEPSQPLKPTENPPQKKAVNPSKPKKSGQKAPKLAYPLYPSVEHLIKEHKLDESAISEITPTGPQGRLLKGDVLAYLGAISKGRPSEIEARFNHNAHLDLSNIKLAKPAAAPPAKKTDKPAAAEFPIPKDLLVSLPVSLAAVIEVQKKIQDNLGTFMPLSTFVSRAAELANDELPLAGNFKPTADDLFNQVLGLDKVDPKVSRGYYMPQISALPPSSFTGVAPKPKSAKVDIIDFLAGTVKRSAPKSLRTSGISTGVNTFSLTVSKPEEKRAQAFLARLKVVLENDPGRLVL